MTYSFRPPEIHEDKPIEVTYKFNLPDHSYDLKVMQKAHDLNSALDEIYNACRHVWKYDDNTSPELVEFAERFGALASDAQVKE